MMPAGSRILPTHAPGPQIALVTLPAEIDAAHIALVEAALASALAARPAVLIADGTNTAFCDSSGIAALVRAHSQAAATGAQLRVVVTSGSPMRRIMELTAADQLLLVYPSLPGAQADGSPQLAPPPGTDPDHEETA